MKLIINCAPENYLRAARIGQELASGDLKWPRRGRWIRAIYTDKDDGETVALFARRNEESVTIYVATA